MKRLSILFLSVLLAAALIGFSGCENDYPDSIYDPDEQGGPTPVINSILPEGGGLAGVSEIVINGENFNSTPQYNLVFFNGTAAEVLSASPNQLVVKAPVMVSDSINIKIAVHMSEFFSNSMMYSLQAAVSDLTGFTPSQEATAIANDAEGNCYVVLIEGGAGVGFKKITPDGELSDYAPRGSITAASGMKVGPSDVIYALIRREVIIQVEAPNTNPSVFVSRSGLGRVVDLDFDEFDNIWTAGENAEVYRVTPEKSVTAYAFEAEIRSVRVFGGHVYFAGNKDGVEGIWRVPFNADGPSGEFELYFDFGAAAGSDFVINAITFAADGTLYLGTDAPEGIYTVSPEMQFGPLYPGLFPSPILYFAWGMGDEMYAVQEGDPAQEIIQKILIVKTFKSSAPYYGVQ